MSFTGLYSAYKLVTATFWRYACSFTVSVQRSELSGRLLFDFVLVIEGRLGGTRCRSWLRHCATSRDVAGSIPDSVIGIFRCHNPTGRTVALGSTQPLSEMSTRNISWGGGLKAAGA